MQFYLLYETLILFFFCLHKLCSHLFQIGSNVSSLVNSLYAMLCNLQVLRQLLMQFNSMSNDKNTLQQIRASRDPFNLISLQYSAMKTLLLKSLHKYFQRHKMTTIEYFEQVLLFGMRSIDIGSDQYFSSFNFCFLFKVHKLQFKYLC